MPCFEVNGIRGILSVALVLWMAGIISVAVVLTLVFVAAFMADSSFACHIITLMAVRVAMQKPHAWLQQVYVEVRGIP